MTSYLVYLLSTRATDYPGLYKRGSMQDPNAWPYIFYPQLVKKRLSRQNKKNKIINDAFIFTIIKFIEGDYAKRLSDEAMEEVIALGAYYIQFRTFTYLRVAGATVNPRNLPRYPSDRLFLLEIAQQIESTYDRVRKQCRPCWTWPLVIGPYQIKQK